jgi:prepilin-type N-terminal cleavage/methylation domain-containing protein/prepilin-type processing-associated H-X9-DG protein
MTYHRIWQVCVGAVFVAAAASKAYDPMPTVRALQYIGLPDPIVVITVLTLITLEMALGTLLVAVRPPLFASIFAILLLIVFALFLAVLLMLPASPSCGCLSMAFFSSSAKLEQRLGFIRNLMLIFAGVMTFRRNRIWTPAIWRQRGRSISASPGFTLPELLVTIAVIAVLVGILMPTLAHVRERSRQTTCASNLAQIGKSIHAYAAENGGLILRAATTPEQLLGEKCPPWVAMVDVSLRHLSRKDMAIPTSKLRVLKCPSHPQEDAPSNFLINAMGASEPPLSLEWAEMAYTTQLARVRRPGNVILVTEAIDSRGRSRPLPLEICTDRQKELWMSGLQVWARSHLPNIVGERKARIAESRHGDGKINALYFDGSVRSVEARKLVPGDFDDGIRNRSPRYLVQPGA